MLVEINLLSERERDRPAFVVAAISLLLLGLVLGLVFYLMGQSIDKDIQQKANESAEIATQQAAIQSQLQTTELLSDTQKLQKTVEWAQTYQYDTIPILRELTSLLPERGFFTSFSFTAPNVISLVIQFDTSRDAAFYLTQLKASDMVTDSKLLSLSSTGVAETSTFEEEEVEGEDSTSVLMPRYTASYDVTFLDTRMPADGTAVPVDPNAPVTEEPSTDEGSNATEGDSGSGQEGTPTEETTTDTTTNGESENTTETQTSETDAQGGDSNE